MKRLALTLLCTSLSAFSAEQFGGISFHSSVPKTQINLLKKDLKYIYSSPVLLQDKELKQVFGITNSEGPSLHNWLINRVKYIVGESYQFGGQNIVPGSPFFRFPSTPLPDMKNGLSESSIKTVMINMGTAMYNAGKEQNFLFGARFDNINIYATSPRLGLIQVGEGLFDPTFALNKDPAATSNSISRLSTLFHEARHSDGNGKSTGFGHIMCPEDHPYNGFYACEKSSNGSYKVGALSTRQLYLNCYSCSNEEKYILELKIADSFSRILNQNDDKIALLKKSNENLKEIITSYRLHKITTADLNKKINYQNEISRLEKIVSDNELKLRVLEGLNPPPQPLSSAPEGRWIDMNLEQTKKIMAQSLEQK